MFGKVSQKKKMTFNEIGLSTKIKSFGFMDDNTVLVDINFELERQQVLAILGPSGCGKSTLLRITAGILKSDVGSILINGRSPELLQKEKKIGIAFQDSCLIEWLSVKQNILIPNKIGLISERAEVVEKRANDLIELIGLTPYQDYLPSQLSGGMQQRVSFARALINKPEVLLLDEPFSKLDSFTKTNLMIDFSKILSQEKTTTIFITHNIEEAVFLSNKIILLSNKPATILEELTNNLPQPRNLDTYNLPDFEKQMSYCRNLLMSGKLNNVQ